MRPTSSSTMLQQNNNNNYPCLDVSGSTRDMLQKCSRASLPFPSRLELGLGDLPLIRGLRAWALCSKNRRKAGGLLGGGGGGQAPTVPPAGRAGSTSCPRPADVYLSGEWGRLGYGLPLGVDAGQAGIGALVTVATLKTSEGSGKTQTQCLFLRTEKGSCLYSTAKPGSGAASSVVGGWLRGKTGGGGGSRDSPAGRRDNGQAPPAHTGANRVRVRSGRRWRKSCSAAGREKGGVREGDGQQGRSREDPAGGTPLEERQEGTDKGGADTQQTPDLLQDTRRTEKEKEKEKEQEKECTCSHDISPKTCSWCGPRAQRRGSRDEEEEGGGGGPRRGDDEDSEEKGMRRERQKKEEGEEGGGGLCSLEAAPNPDPESKRCHPESQSGRDPGEIRDEEPGTETSQRKDHSNSEIMKTRARDEDLIQGRSKDEEEEEEDFTLNQNGDLIDRKPSEKADGDEPAANSNGSPDHVEADRGSGKETKQVGDEEEEEEEGRSIDHPPPADLQLVPSLDEGFPITPESSWPLGGSTRHIQHKTINVGSEEEESGKEDQHGEEAPEQGIVGEKEEEEVNFRRFEEQPEPSCVAEDGDDQVFSGSEGKCSDEEEEEESRVENSSLETDGGIVGENSCIFSETEPGGAEDVDEFVWVSREEESQEEEEEEEEEVNPEAAEIWRRRRRTCNHQDDENGKREHKDEEIRRNCALAGSRRPQEEEMGGGGGGGSRSDHGDTCGPTSITHHVIGNSANVINVPSATLATLSPANPAPSLPPLGTMATEEEEEEEEKEEEGVRETAGDGEGEEGEGEGGREGKRRELESEEQGEEERGSTVATEEEEEEKEEVKEEEEEEEDEFGVFMQAEGEPAWSEGPSMSASVPCGSRESVVFGANAVSGDSTHWTPGWTDGSFPQSDNGWSAFPQDPTDEGVDTVGQWWPSGAGEQSRGRLASIFSEAFPSLPGSSSPDLAAVPTLTQLLRGRNDPQDQDHGLLDSFHDLNKMICQRYKRADGVSRDLLLRTLHLELPQSESRPAPRPSSRRLSPGLPSANQHAQNATAKRRLSYDYNRNVME